VTAALFSLASALDNVTNTQFLQFYFLAAASTEWFIGCIRCSSRRVLLHIWFLSCCYYASSACAPRSESEYVSFSPFEPVVNISSFALSPLTLSFLFFGVEVTKQLLMTKPRLKFKSKPIQKGLARKEPKTGLNSGDRRTTLKEWI